MAEAPTHLLTALTDEIAANPSLVGIEGKIDVDAERELKPGDIDIDVFGSIEITDDELSTPARERIVKIINLLADKKDGYNGQSMFFEILNILRRIQEEEAASSSSIRGDAVPTES